MTRLLVSLTAILVATPLFLGSIQGGTSRAATPEPRPDSYVPTVVSTPALRPDSYIPTPVAMPEPRPDSYIPTPAPCAGGERNGC